MRRAARSMKYSERLAEAHRYLMVQRKQALAVTWLLEAQNADGGWGGSRGVTSSIEETGVVLAALGRSVRDGDERRVSNAIARGARWLMDADVGAATAASPVGLYFARLWYYEDLYPLVFAVEGLAAARAALTVPHNRT